jgi:pyruvate kinase
MRDKKVKILATLGPASYSPEIIKKLAQEGVDIFRINLSHAGHNEVIRLIHAIRHIEDEIDKPITIMGDLAGPKIRIGEVTEGTTLANGQQLRIVTGEVLGTSESLSINFPSIIPQLKKGALVYIDDGRIQLEVEKDGRKEVLAKVIVGGPLLSFKGFYAEGISLDLEGLSEKDKKDIGLIVKEGVDAIAVSFVQSERDIRQVKERLPDDSQIMLIAKMETAKGIENIDSIIEAADGIMVARGDLGLAVPIAEVPHLQKRLINLCLAAAKPVITATQMLESMHHNPIPTRAEVTDVANAILDGTDAVMLSGETAMGEFPVETVRTMVKIILTAVPHVTPRYFQDLHETSNSVAGAVGDVADQIKAKVIFAFTQKGKNARHVSRHRHSEVILAPSPLQATLRRLNFTWGVYPIHITTTVDFDNMRQQAREIAQENAYTQLKKGESYVIVAGLPFGESGTINMIFVDKL